MEQSRTDERRSGDTIGSLTWRLLAYTRPYLRVVAAILVLGLVFAGGRIGRAYLIKPLIDDVLLPAQYAEEVVDTAAPGISPSLDATQDSAAELERGPDDENAELRQASGEFLGGSDAFLKILLASVAIILVMPLALFGRLYLSQWVFRRITVDMQREIAGKMLAVPLAYHRAGKSGDLLSRALNDVGECELALKMLLNDFLTAAVILIVGVSMLIVISWQLALISLLSMPLIVGVLALFAGRIRRGARRRQAQLGEVAQRLTAILSGIKVIKAFRGEALEARAFARETEKLFVRAMKVVKARIISRSLIDMLNNATAIWILMAGAWFVLHGYWGLTTGDIAAFAAVLASTYKPIKTLSRGYASLADALASGERFFEVLDEEAEPADPADAVEIDGIERGIRLDRVCFSYGDERILRDVSLDVARGEVIAVVGPTGGGKTTLIDLLLRFYEVDSGSIEIDGVDLRRISRDSLLAQVAVVTQEPFLFDTTILENIRYGRPEASEGEIMRASVASHVDEFVSQLPKGYETQVGEFGMRLSGGQRQRITIARAILKQPALLVFDEATSSLDAKTERTVQEAINTLRGEQTIFLVAHRLSTIRQADRIVVIERGKVTQIGTHQELMAQKAGLYRELVALQLETNATATSTVG